MICALLNALLTIIGMLRLVSISSSLCVLALVLGFLVGTPHVDTPGRMEIG